MEITERSATDLARAIRDGELSSREVVEAHVERARRLNPDLTAIAAERFDLALAEADAADSFAVAGMPNAAGLVHRADLRADADAPADRRHEHVRGDDVDRVLEPPLRPN